MTKDGESWVATFENGSMVLASSGKLEVDCS
jgi:hypothetical protein